MPIQFAGSSSTGGRRRRRLVANGEGPGVDALLLDGDGAEIESQLVASEAAAPWVPATELRIWIYTAIIGLFLGGLTFALARPIPFRPELNPLADHLLAGSRPVLVVAVQTLFLALSAQLGMLIGWYRSRCRLDFGGRYRVWPWAVGLIGLAAFCLATNSHLAFGEVVGRSELLPWRGHTVAWLLPFCLAALPMTLLLDRDVRNSRSSLFTLRLSGLLWLAGAWFELYQTELQSQVWFGLARQLVPLFASATLFLGLWLHARIVAYVCPDPPELEQRSAWSLLLTVCGWIVPRLMFWKSRGASDDEEAAKPKRRRKKADGEEAKRKRKAPVKRTTSRTRTRVKSADDEEVDEPSGETSDDESDSVNETSVPAMPQERSSSDNDQEQWEHEPDEWPAARPSVSESRVDGQHNRIHQAHPSAVPAPHSRRQTISPQQEPGSEEQTSNQFDESGDETDEDRQFQLDSGMTSDQMKGLSKRQKRELKKQIRDQERARGR